MTVFSKEGGFQQPQSDYTNDRLFPKTSLSGRLRLAEKIAEKSSVGTCRSGMGCGTVRVSMPVAVLLAKVITPGLPVTRTPCLATGDSLSP
jgi:hypothetical protein